MARDVPSMTGIWINEEDFEDENLKCRILSGAVSSEKICCKLLLYSCRISSLSPVIQSLIIALNLDVSIAACVEAAGMVTTVDNNSDERWSPKK